MNARPVTPVMTVWLLVLLLAGACSSAPTAERSTGPPSAAAQESPVAVLQAWDERRATAWAGGDVDALRRLYVAGSVAGARDVAMLRRYVERGLTVAALDVQVLSGRVVARKPDRLTVEVTERLAHAAASDGARSWRLPRGGVATRRVTLRLVRGDWLVARVIAVAPSAHPSAQP
ncbi:hypothetical protein [Nocardioides lijunqiniae]|uniref:hypothetical protein n=1 Tax=Nocardioides lijunqiniae TaxID=2760832 RepID=UPI001878A0C9|nr:hypothetical protein [Nocardioides lijunqiniae]